MADPIAVRRAFLGAGEGKLRVENLGITQESAGARLTITGFHADGTEFAVVSPPTDDPIATAYQMAGGILTTHTGVSHMPAPAAIKGLAATLREQLTAATARAATLGAKAQDSVKNLHAVLDTADGVVSDLDKAAAEVQSALGLNTNGGDPL